MGPFRVALAKLVHLSNLMMMSDEERGFFLCDALQRDLSYVHHAVTMNEGRNVPQEQEQYTKKTDSRAAKVSASKANASVRDRQKGGK